MHIILPPSETKSFGGEGAPLDLSRLSLPTLTAIRESIAHDLVELANPYAVLGLSENRVDEVAANRALFSSPTTPAVFRYTGVLYDALGADQFPVEFWDAYEDSPVKFSIGSALFGVVEATDLIPHYRLSATTKLPHRETPWAPAPTMKSRFGSELFQALEDAYDQELVLDLRSGGYKNLGKVPGAVTLRVEQAFEDGSRKVVSHFNKHFKGVITRELLLAGKDARTAGEFVELGLSLGFELEADPAAVAAHDAVTAARQAGDYKKLRELEVTMVVRP